MSTCISSHGEYDAHETDPDTYVCKWCHEFDETGAMAEIARLRGGPVAGMEHAIEQATERAERVLAPHFRNVALGGVEDDTHLGALVLRAVDALAEAGLLSAAPLREEWGVWGEDDAGDWELGDAFKSREEAEQFMDKNPWTRGKGGYLVRRPVHDWLPVDGGQNAV